MRVLPDENLDRRLKRHLPPDEFEALTVRERGRGSIENGELLRLAQEKFDIFLAVDRGIPHQQNLSRFDVALVLLEAGGNKLADSSRAGSRARRADSPMASTVRRW